MSDDAPLCPSAIGKVGAKLIGIASGPGAMGYLSRPVDVDEDFLAAAGEEPERRFRFADRCHEDRCHNWADDHCQLIHQILTRRPDPEPSQLPPCGIRSSCRWFAQAGRAACQMCPVVRTPGTKRETQPGRNQ